MIFVEGSVCRWWWFCRGGRLCLVLEALGGGFCGVLLKRSVTYRFTDVLIVLRLMLHLEGIERRSCRGCGIAG